MVDIKHASDLPAAPLPTAWPTNPLLRGVKVLDLSRLLPGPLCGMLLAQLGAEVTKIAARWAWCSTCASPPSAMPFSHW
jgi:crotonobetainyl-CoA:carnitine CoA-transferase CaiB-like acyl-CoA transferase